MGGGVRATSVQQLPLPRSSQGKQASRVLHCAGLAATWADEIGGWMCGAGARCCWRPCAASLTASIPLGCIARGFSGKRFEGAWIVCLARTALPERLRNADSSRAGQARQAVRHHRATKASQGWEGQKWEGQQAHGCSTKPRLFQPRTSVSVKASAEGRGDLSCCAHLRFSLADCRGRRRSVASSHE